MIEVDCDNDPDGIIMVAASGMWTAANVDGFYHYLKHKMCERRSRKLPIRVLIDVVDLEPPPPEVAVRTLWQVTHSFEPEDRVAVLAKDVGQKQRLRDLFAETNVAVFSSRLPLEMWLMSDIGKSH